jgi:methyl-accepting chemotaxis protein
MLATASIRTKITVVVAFLLVAMTGLGIIAVRSMKAVNTSAAEIQSGWLPNIRLLGELQKNVVQNRSVSRAYLLADTAEGKEAVAKRYDGFLRIQANIREKYGKLIKSQEERALYDEWSRQWDRFQKGTDEVWALSRKTLGGVPYEAVAMNENIVNPQGAKSDDFLKKILDLDNKGADDAARTATEIYDSAFTLVAILLGVAMLIGTGVGFYLVRDVSRGIASIVTPMQALGNGDLTAIVPHQGETTEIGSMATALQVFKEALIAKKVSDEAATLDADAKIQRGQRVDNITCEFESLISELVGSLSSSSTHLEASASTLTSTAERAQELTTMVAAASEEASINVQSVASATEEMTSSVNEISRQVRESARMANEAVDQARTTTERVSELSKAASRIGDVVELINTIAGQTNLLALNATIEAARAGDAGRGFAVVASEVKALAEQTAKATGEIGQQISGIQAATQESVGAIREISVTIERLSEIASAVAAAVEQQGGATQEISRNVQQAAQGTQQVSANITDVQRGATETGSASTQVLSAARSLSGDSNRLKVEVSKFLGSVRAA